MPLLTSTDKRRGWPVPVGAHAHGHAALVAELDGVAQEVDEHLPQLAFIHRHLAGRLVPPDDLQLQALRFGPAAGTSAPSLPAGRASQT